MSETTTTAEGKTQAAGATGTSAEGTGVADAATKPAEGGATQEAGKTGEPATKVEGDSNAAKTEGDKAKATEGDPAKAKEGADVDLALKLPDGVAADEATLAEFKGLAKELGLKSEQAQKLVDFQVRLSEQAEKARAEQDRVWADAVRKDKELGGDKFDGTVTNARKAVDRFGTPALREFFDKSGLGSHPEMVRFCNNVAKQLAEDSVAGTVQTGSGASSEDQKLRQMYPTMFAGKE